MSTPVGPKGRVPVRLHPLAFVVEGLDGRFETNLFDIDKLAREGAYEALGEPFPLPSSLSGAEPAFAALFDDIRVLLTLPELDRMIRTDLRPGEVQALRGLFGDFDLIGSTFYGPNRRARAVKESPKTAELAARLFRDREKAAVFAACSEPAQSSHSAGICDKIRL